MISQSSINVIFEAAVVKRMQRTGWQILGDNRETVGEHSFMTAVIAYILGLEIDKREPIQMEKILIMSIFHDFHEGRIGDTDKIATFYITRNTAKANQDIFTSIDPELLHTVEEYEEKKSMEATIVYESNVLALLVELKQLVEKGNSNAVEWLKENAKRVRLPESVECAEQIMSGNTQDWWRDIRKKLSVEFSK